MATTYSADLGAGHCHSPPLAFFTAAHRTGTIHTLGGAGSPGLCHKQTLPARAGVEPQERAVPVFCPFGAFPIWGPSDAISCQKGVAPNQTGASPGLSCGMTRRSRPASGLLICGLRFRLRQGWWECPFLCIPPQPAPSACEDFCL
jgi:hypothetical protein